MKFASRALACQTVHAIQKSGHAATASTGKKVALAGDLFLSNLDAGLASAIADLSHWKWSRSPEVLDRIVFWLTQSGSYEIFKSCLFALQCEHPTYGKAEEWEVDFYTAHPWLTRGGMRELLKALVASDASPSAKVLLCCAFQHSHSPFDFSNIDLDYA